MKYVALRTLLRKRGWNTYYDDGDVCFRKGNAQLWVQRDEDGDPYIWDDEQEECYLDCIYRLIFTRQHMIIVWNDGDEWFYDY